MELTPIVELGEDKTEGFIITGRKVLAKYEVLSVATAKTKQKIKYAHIEEENGKVFWVVASNNEEIRFDLTTGEPLKVQPLRSGEGAWKAERSVS